MNILVPHKWLLEHLETNATPQDIQRCLSLCGPSVERLYEREEDIVYDIEVTTNRVDSASVRGIAREAAAILPEFGFKAKLRPLTLNKIASENSNLDIEIVNDSKLCHRIVAVKLKNVNLSASPEWLAQRLRQIDLRPINNAIDITNYCMWDLGHPIHAFDYDKLSTKKIVVREAKKGETFITLDDKHHTCKGGEVVFDDGTNTIIDLPGIMGTANTAVSDKTKNVLLWIESIDAVKIRKASMGLSIRSQAAVLNEKNVDPELAPTSLNRAISLYQQLAKAAVASSIIDIYPHPKSIQSTKLEVEKIEAYLGVKISPKRITQILESLGCEVKTEKTSFTITPPSFRQNDLSIPEDYIEEIARIYGYHNLPSIIMPTPIPDRPGLENFPLEYQIKQWLTGWGGQEVYTYSMVSNELAKLSGFPLKDHLKIANPLSDDWVYLRRTLIPSLTEVFANNSVNDRFIFELQNTYQPNHQDLPSEELHLTLISNQTYSKFKGILDALIQKLYIEDYRVDVDGHIVIGKKTIGDIKPINAQLYSIDLLLTDLVKSSHTHPQSLILNSYPSIIEDLTFTLPAKTFIGPIIDYVYSLNPFIASVTIKDVYKENHTFTLKYQSSDKGLSTEEIAPIRKQIVEVLKKKFNATLVGNL